MPCYIGMPCTERLQGCMNAMHSHLTNIYTEPYLHGATCCCHKSHCSGGRAHEGCTGSQPGRGYDAAGSPATSHQA